MQKRYVGLLSTLALLAICSTWNIHAQVACITCPPDSEATAVGAGLGVAVVRNGQGQAVLPGQFVGSCEQIFVLASVSYQPNVLIQTPAGPTLVVGSGFFGGQGRILVSNGNPLSPIDVTPTNMATTKVGPISCADSLVAGMKLLPYTLTPADIANGSVTFTFVYTQGHSLLGDCSLEVQAGNQAVVQILGPPSCAIAPASQEVCAGQTATFTASSTGPPQGAPHTFSWTGPGGFTGTGPIITVGTAGTYTATITDQLGCTSTCTAQLVVNPLPACVIGPALLELCVGSSATFTANVTGGTPPFGFAWTGPNNFTATGASITRNNITLADLGDFRVRVTDAKGCFSDCLARLQVIPCIPDVEVGKEVACFLGADVCGPYSEVATGVRNDSCPAFCYRFSITNADDDTIITELVVTDTELGNISALFADALPLVPGEVVVREVKAHTLCQTTTNVVTALGRTAQGEQDVDTDTAAAVVLNINIECDLTLASSFDMDENPNNNSVILPAGSVDVPITLNFTLRNTGTSPLSVTNITGLPPLVDCETGDPITVTLPFSIAADSESTLSACTLVSCPGASFSVRAFGVASDEGGTLCVFDSEGNVVTDATDVCPGTVVCEQAVTCRVTGGGVLLPGTTDESCITVNTTISPSTTPNGLTINKITWGHQVGSPFSVEDCGEVLGNPCIRGNVSHERHFNGQGNPRDIFENRFHTATPKSPWDSFSCACLGCCDPETGAFITPITIGEICNPDDRKNCGPLPRPAPANAVIMSGIFRGTPTDDIQGNRAEKSEWYIVRIYEEDRSEPGGAKPGGSIEPADIYCFQAWRTGIKVTKKPDFSAVAEQFRRALGQANCQFLRDLQSGVLPIGSLPSPVVMGMTADINDCGPVSTGQVQIHPGHDRCPE